ncbi:upstream stimulatory factor 2-like isoform X3 [Limulus polyphemus]|uniref:Upstream stimulatory factor 2-like isoform X3 n=1 Tax=Limulus polyphemus TaxID=6850 RepID=A0ABM1S7X4_LIMPO|nr:upstream stimulatory factor 2-like isoform X3 [Limulus polyphemus]
MDLLDQDIDTSSGDKVNDSGASDDTSHMQADDSSVNTIEDATELHDTSNILDPMVQYQLRAENGQGAVTYRVVQIAQECELNADGAGHVVTTAPVITGQQTVITSYSTASGGGSPTADVHTQDTRFTYFPAVADGGITTSQSETAALAASNSGQFYVVMSPQDVFHPGQRTLAPRTHQFSPKFEVTRRARDERRRATHNEVERRRRDKINNWIVKLSKVVPDCSSDHTKQGQSKGGILAKAYDYIQELRNANVKLPEILKDNEKLLLDAGLLRRQCEELKNENQMFKAHLQQQGISIVDKIDTNTA